VIAERLEPYLKNVAVNVKFLNFRYTIIGDISAPGTYSTLNERVSVLEAVGTAGDLTNYADRDRIILIREEDGLRKVVRLNLQDDDFFSSPYYYLQQNDVIYIEPLPSKVATVADPIGRVFGFASAGISLVTLIITIITRSN
jgi:polysaccharide export outer membrane protein